MGRFDPKYPPTAIAELYRLVLDEQLSVPKALAEIARTHGVEIVPSTAYGHVQRARTDSKFQRERHHAAVPFASVAALRFERGATPFLIGAGAPGLVHKERRARPAALTLAREIEFSLL